MSKQFLIFFSVILFIGCSKDKSKIDPSIKINYNIGDHSTYEYYVENHFDDTTQTNRDTTYILTDTVEKIIEKDTLINDKKCLVILSKSAGKSDHKDYLEITDTSYNYFAYLFVQNNEILFYEKPVVAYKTSLSIGTSWDINTGIPNKMLVTDITSLNIKSKTYTCAKLQFKLQEKGQNGHVVNFEEYVDEKGVVLSKHDIEKFEAIFSDKSAGYIEGKYRMTRIE